MRHVFGILIVSSSFVFAAGLKPTKAGYIIPQLPLTNIKRVENHSYHNAKGIYTDTVTIVMGAMPVVVWESDDYGVYPVKDYVLSLTTNFKNPAAVENLKDCRESAMASMQNTGKILVVTPKEMGRTMVFFTPEELVKNVLNQQLAFIQTRANKKVNNLVNSLYSYWTDPGATPDSAEGQAQGGGNKPKMPPIDDLLGNLTELSQQIVLRKSLSQNLDTQPVECQMISKEKFFARLEGMQ